MVVLTACNTKTTQKSNNISQEVKKQVEVSTGEVLFSMRRTGCLGPCPVYELKLFANGTIQYWGIHETDRLGKYQAKTDTQSKYKAILEKALKMDYFEMSDLYPEDYNMIMDAPACIISISHKGEMKTIKTKMGAPQKLAELQDYADILWLEESLEWKPVAMEPIQNN